MPSPLKDFVKHFKFNIFIPKIFTQAIAILYLWALMVFCIYCKRHQRLDQKVERGVAS